MWLWHVFLACGFAMQMQTLGIASLAMQHEQITSRLMPVFITAHDHGLLFLAFAVGKGCTGAST